MQNEGVPHEVHVQEGPVVVGALDQVKVGEAICYHVKVWENAVEEDEQGHLSCCDDVPEEMMQYITI